MSEVVPQFTYSPDGILKVHITYDDPRLEKTQRQGIEQLAQYNGIQIEDADAQTEVSIDISRALGPNFNNSGDEKVLEFLKHLSDSLAYHPEGATDRVASLDTITYAGAFASIYPQFQRWLNTQGLDEGVSKESVLAMATPFGKSMLKKSARDFVAFESGGRGWAFEVTSYPDRFGIDTQEETEDSIIERHGKVRWDWAYLVTLGSCACWGVNGEDRSHIRIRPDNARLYDMTPHNVDFARQTLSHILGLGALTYRASEYEGKEDLLADVEWGEPSTHPK
ncbi:hypothetical protein HYW36_00650 [Candidatus Saccharibacteria bacterium]|nr:hypothetical protein [Candidatus Saccharibacteria bacterium]